MRSTEPDAAAGARFEGCVFAATPSLGTLMQLLVGIEVHKLAARAQLREPGIEAGWDQAVGALLLVGGANRDDVRVFVFHMLVVPAHPAPIHRMGARDLGQLLPEIQVLERAGLPPPAACFPSRQPLGHPFDEILRVGHEPDVGVSPLPPDPFERPDRAGERHLVVGRLGRALVEIPTRDAVAGRRFDQRAVPSAARLGGVVAETALVGVHEHKSSRHGWITTGMSVCSRISSACDTVTACRSPTCAPANSASHCVRAMTRATASPGVPCSRCVTNATPCSDNSASASPTTMVPIAGSIVA